MARLPIVTGLLLVAVIQTTMSIRVQEFFPQINNNLTKIQWSHATNSKAKLQAALNSTEVMMIEADVIWGYQKLSDGSTSQTPTVIMGHPPANTSDLNLLDFLMSVKKNNADNKTNKKGIKLDFKSIEAFTNATPILDAQTPFALPVWVNADILTGPVNATDTKPVSPKAFLEEATKANSQSVLSIGWTTRYVGPIANASTSGNYTAEHIKEMLKYVNESIKTNQSITYPVRACYAANDIEVMKTLLAGTPAKHNATLTIWSGAGDKIDATKLSQLVRTIGVDKVFVDLPKNVMNKLNFNSAFTAKSSVFVVFASMIVALFTAKFL